MDLNNFIKSLTLDDHQRILVSVHEFLESYLAAPENRKMIKDGLIQMLGDDFKQLEIGKNVCRITVTASSEEAMLKKLKHELKSAIEMAMDLMTTPPEQGPKN